MLSAHRLLVAATVVMDRAPDAVLIKNHVGNLAIERDGDYVGWVDLRTGEVEFFEDRGGGRVAEDA